jgi:hypothetical protein
MEELIVEGITPEDLLLLKRIIETYTVSIKSEISFDDISNIYNKITDIVRCLEDK